MLLVQLAHSYMEVRLGSTAGKTCGSRDPWHSYIPAQISQVAGCCGTSVAVLQKLMRHADIRTTMNIYGNIVIDEMDKAGNKFSLLAFQTNGAQAELSAS